MNVDEESRARLTWLTDDVTGGPDLASVVREGRRRRRRRRVLGGVAATAVVGLAAGTALQLAQGQDRQIAVDDPGFAAEPSYPDFVPGTQLDEKFQGAIAGHLTTLSEATDAYPSDWNTSGPIPDGQWANATDWQVIYQVGADERMTVLTGKKTPGEHEGDGCGADPNSGSDQPPCTTVDVPGGRVVADSYRLRLGMDTVFVFTTTFVRDNGSEVNAIQQVKSDTWAHAVADVAFGPAQLQPVVTDDQMVFPDPVDPPPPPNGH
jgi:hypothetical protein